MSYLTVIKSPILRIYIHIWKLRRMWGNKLLFQPQFTSSRLNSSIPRLEKEQVKIQLSQHMFLG
jgi:hypothetical protein